MTIRALCIAGALTLGFSGAAAAQSLYIDTPVVGMGVGVGPHAYGWSDRGYYGHRSYYGQRDYYRDDRRGAYGYSEFGGPTYYAPSYGIRDRERHQRRSGAGEG